MAIEKEKNNSSEYKSKRTSFILFGVWVALVLCSAILFGLIGQTMIEVFNNVTSWTSSNLAIFISAIVTGCLGLISYISWAILLFKKPKVISLDKKNEDEEKNPTIVENVTTGPATSLTPSVVPGGPVAIPAAPMSFPQQPGYPPRPISPAPMGYPQQPGYPPRPMGPTPMGYPQQPPKYPQR